MTGTLYHLRVGRGEEVVFLHGWGMHSGVWEDVAEALVDTHRLTLIDLPGHGYSRGGPGGHSLADMARAVAAVAPPRAAWVGWSLGGLVAQRLALDAPHRVSRLALVCTSPSFVRRPGWPHAMEYAVLHQFAENLGRDHRGTLKRFLALEVQGSEHATAQLRQLREMVFQHGEPDPSALADGLAILEGTDLRAELAGLAAPVLLVMGRRDNLVPASAGEAVAAMLPGARLRVLEGAGHAPFFSHPEVFTGELRAFLDPPDPGIPGERGGP